MSNGLPVVNMNGATKQSLIECRQDAYRALHDAMKALQECSPHGRDYQTAQAGEYEVARKRYIERFSLLDRMANELSYEAIEISKQGGR